MQVAGGNVRVRKRARKVNLENHRDCSCGTPKCGRPTPNAKASMKPCLPSERGVHVMRETKCARASSRLCKLCMHASAVAASHSASHVIVHAGVHSPLLHRSRPDGCDTLSPSIRHPHKESRRWSLGSATIVTAVPPPPLYPSPCAGQLRGLYSPTAGRGDAKSSPSPWPFHPSWRGSLPASWVTPLSLPPRGRSPRQPSRDSRTRTAGHTQRAHSEHEEHAQRAQRAQRAWGKGDRADRRAQTARVLLVGEGEG